MKISLPFSQAIVFTFIFLISQNSIARDYPIDLQKATVYFQQVRQLCDEDDGAVWGENLWGPIILIDPVTRFAVANQPDSEDLLEQVGEVYIGYFPQDQGVANSTTQFGGKKWMMVMFPLPENEYQRNQLGIHELYHLLQQRQNLSFSNYNNDHMDHMEARILIKLEWLALEKAMGAKEEHRTSILTDALIFRNYRRSLYPGKAAMENEMEVHEGLAEYTGHRICARNDEDFIQQVLLKKQHYWNAKTYVRSFGYHSGLLYAFLLDFGPSWRNTVHAGTDLGSLVQMNHEIQLPQNLEEAYQEAKDHYDFTGIWEFETQRENNKQEMLQAYRVKFTRDPVLTLMVPNPRIVFNPSNLVPLDALGTVYPTMSIMSDWGNLQVTEGGCLFDWKKAVVSACGMVQENNILKGEGWVLEMNENWKLINNGREYTLIQME